MKENQDPIAILVFKIFAAILAGLMIFYVGKPMLTLMLGLSDDPVTGCNTCDPLTKTFVTSAFAILTIMVMIYKMVSIFGKESD